MNKINWTKPKHYLIQRVYKDGREHFSQSMLISSDVAHLRCEQAAIEEEIDYVALWLGSVKLDDLDLDYLVNEYSTDKNNIRRIAIKLEQEGVINTREYGQGDVKSTPYCLIPVYTGWGRWNLKPPKVRKKAKLRIDINKFTEMAK